MTHVAVDVLGDDPEADDPARAAAGPDAAARGPNAARPVPGDVLDGLLAALDADGDLRLVIVGPAPALADALAARGVAPGDRVRLADGPEFAGASDDPSRAVRARRRASVRVAARLVRDGVADAFVSRGPLGATVTAAVFVLGRVPGATRASVARVVAAPGGPVVLLDTGVSSDATPDLLGQFALAGAAYASARFGLATPRVGLLSTDADALEGGDMLRRSGATLLAGLGPSFAGLVTADAVARGGVVDVVVTDGFTGSVVASALSGAAEAGGPELAPDCVVLGVDGVVVDAGPGPDRIARAVALAAGLHAAGITDSTRALMTDLVARRRSRAGLST